MNVLELFAGAGGGILGSRILGHRTVCAVELDPYCREILLRRQEEGHLEPFPIWDDVKSFDGGAWRGIVDVVSAGFPCQPFSGAHRGRGVGAADDRNMWPQTIRVIREVGAELVFLENVPNLLAHDYYGQILGDLAEAGFDAGWAVVPAAAVGAPHVRARVWILAYTDSDRLQAWLRGRLTTQPSERDLSDLVRVQEVWDSEIAAECQRSVDGVASRLDRLRAIGNGQVPLVAAEAWRRLNGREDGVGGA